jgi:hypothetical protein
MTILKERTPEPEATNLPDQTRDMTSMNPNKEIGRSGPQAIKDNKKVLLSSSSIANHSGLPALEEKRTPTIDLFSILNLF